MKRFKIRSLLRGYAERLRNKKLKRRREMETYDTREEAIEALGTAAVAQCDYCESWCAPKHLVNAKTLIGERAPYEWVCHECIPQLEARNAAKGGMTNEWYVW